MKVKEKKVELIELFYDLIYVYAISKLTMLIEEPEGGIIPPTGFFRYLVVCFVILQAWLYLTNYVNRYGRWKRMRRNRADFYSLVRQLCCLSGLRSTDS